MSLAQTDRYGVDRYVLRILFAALDLSVADLAVMMDRDRGSVSNVLTGQVRATKEFADCFLEVVRHRVFGPDNGIEPAHRGTETSS